MKDVQRPWGFWFRIATEEDARYAAKMAGLPIFLTGAWGLLSAVLFFAHRPLWLGALIAIIGCMFVYAGLRIRAERFALVPVMVPLYLILVGINIALTPAVNAALPILTGALSINGLCGWWWLRRNGA